MAQFIEEHYGTEAVDYLAEPLLSGIYGGDPRDLSVSSVLPRFVQLANQYGSLTRGVLAERAKAVRNGPAAPLFRTLKGGLGQLVEAAAAAIRGHAEIRQVRAETIERSANHPPVSASARAAIGSKPPAWWWAAKRTAPPSFWRRWTRAWPSCWARSPTALRSPWRWVSMPPTFPRRRMASAFWFPRRSAAAWWPAPGWAPSSSHRVPDGKIVARCFMGGTEDAGVLAESDETLVAAATRELQRDCRRSPREPRFTRIFRWPRSMAQPTVGHPARVAEIEARVAAIPGLHLAGNAYQGIGIPDCIRLGRQAAGRILAG